ncbi:hypothetical protein GCK32_007130, partial [Trichostrongylus colubriformis]
MESDIRHPKPGEYYDSISRLMDHTLINANRLLEKLKPEKKSNVDRSLPYTTESSGSSMPMSSSSTPSDTIHGSTRAFQNYVDTPSRMRTRGLTNQNGVTPAECKSHPSHRTASGGSNARGGDSGQAAGTSAADKDADMDATVEVHNAFGRGVTIKHAKAIYIKTGK